MSDDWRTYDGIADRYDGTWAPRFEQVARHLSRSISRHHRDRLLDIGTGTGIVARTLLADAPCAFAVGCDRSPGMLRRARAQAPLLRAVVADAPSLPFRDAAFTIVTGSFVLSHIRGYPAAIAEIRRVLAGDGLFAASAWALSSDPYTPAWSEYLTMVIPKAEVERAFAEVAPSEDHLAQAGALQAAFERGGFSPLASDTVGVDIDVTVEEFIADRELNSASRLARSRAGPERWSAFRAAAREMLQGRFGPSFRYQRQAHVVVGRKS